MDLRINGRVKYSQIYVNKALPYMIKHLLKCDILYSTGSYLTLPSNQLIRFPLSAFFIRFLCIYCKIHSIAICNISHKCRVEIPGSSESTRSSSLVHVASISIGSIL